MRYFVSYTFKLTNGHNGFGNTVVTADEPINSEEQIANLHKSVAEGVTNCETLVVLNFIGIGDRRGLA